MGGSGSRRGSDTDRDALDNRYAFLHTVCTPPKGTTTVHTTDAPARHALPLPSTVEAFFDALRTVGQIVAVRPNGVTVHLHHSGGDALRLLTDLLAQRQLFPAFPADPTYWRPSYCWEFGPLTETAEGAWSTLVPLTADLHTLLGHVTGLGSYPDTYTGEPVLPVDLYPHDSDDLHATRRELEDEIHAAFGELLHLSARD